MQPINLSWVIFLCLFLGLACNDTRLKELPNFVWSSKAPLIFKLQIEDTSQHSVVYKIQYTLDYPYENHYVKFFLVKEGDTLLEGLENITLFDKAGKPLGEKPFGRTYLRKQTILNYPFKAKSYQLICHQYMRTDSLEGVRGVGVELD